MVNVKEAQKYLRFYGYRTTEGGVNKILKNLEVNKAGLRDKLRLHENWDEEAQAIVLKNTEYPRPFTNRTLISFNSWAINKKEKLQESKATEDKSEVYYINKLDDIRSMIRYANRNNKKVEIDGKDVREIQEDAQKEYEDFQERTEGLCKIKEDDEKSYFITREQKTKIDGVYNALCYIKDYCTESNLTAENAEKINNYININASANQKLSRVINKLCTEIGLNEITETQTDTIQERNEQGELETRQVTREVGYQRQFNIMAEGLNTNTYKVHTIISINPMDFWGMSLLHKVASCQTIDIFNFGKRDKSYSGQYSGGTTSLMLDKTTVVMYTVAEDYAGNLYYIQDKMNRCLFSINEEGSVIIQHVVYPDARDGGDPNKSKQYRELMQKIVSELWGHENNWVKKPYDYMNDYSTKKGLHYADTTCNRNSTISLLKNYGREYKRVVIGAEDAICPVCGRKHRNTGNIMCYECKGENYRRELAIRDIYETNAEFEDAPVPSFANYDLPVINTENTEANNTENNDMTTVTCEHCGEVIDIDSAVEIDGNYYCEDCVEDAGYHYIDSIEEYRHEDNGIVETEDDGWQLEDDCFMDNRTEEWYHADPEVVTEDGNQYISYDNAYDDGYEIDREGNWYPQDEMVLDERNGVNVHQSDCVEMDDGTYFVDEETAEENGYRRTAYDEWLREEEVFYDEYENEYYSYEDEEVIEINGRYYGSTESAENDGYVQVDDEWYREDEVFFDELTSTHFVAHEAEVHTEDDKYFLFETSAIMAGYRETENGWVLREERESA